MSGAHAKPGIGTTKPRHPATLVERMTPTVDRLRAVQARLGMLSQRVFVVQYRWSGGDVGQGVPHLVRFIELTPPPEVVGDEEMSYTEAGLTTSTQKLRLVGISPRYTQDDLDILFLDLIDEGNNEVFIEVVRDGRDGATPERQRYKPTAKPNRGDPTNFQWELQIVSSYDGRDRFGKRRYWLPDGSQ